MLFVDARDTEGASIEVSGAWARWLAAHRTRCARIAMLPGSRFIEVTARFVRSFAELDAVMRVYSDAVAFDRSEEHTSELQSLMRISYAVFCLKKKNTQQ